MWEFDFQPYLSAIVAHYTKECDFYTPTDAVLPLQARSVGREQDDREQKVEQFPVLAGLETYALGVGREHVLLAGRPGSGKSTALRQWVGDLVLAGVVPVLLQLKGDRTVPELIKAEFRRFKIRVTDEQIDDWLLADRLVLLLDGVNEIPTEDLRRELQRFREENRSVPMVFTTRDLSLGGDLGIEKRFEMQPLSDRQMRDFVEKYLPEQGNRLLGQLRDRLREIAETPLLLKMLCDVFKQTEQIPQNKGELFRWFDREYDRFKGLPAVSAEFRRFKSEVLQYLAFAMMQGDSRTEFWLTIDRGRAESLIEEWLTGRVSDPAEKAKEWLEDLLEHHLLQVAADGRRVEFHHQLFQEYYAAEHFWQTLERHSNWLEKQEGQEFSLFQQHYLNYLKWTETISLMLGLVTDESLALELVEQALTVDLMLGSRLAGKVRPDIQSQLFTRINSYNFHSEIKIRLLLLAQSSIAISYIEDLLSQNHYLYLYRQFSLSAFGLMYFSPEIINVRINKYDTIINVDLLDEEQAFILYNQNIDPEDYILDGEAPKFDKIAIAPHYYSSQDAKEWSFASVLSSESISKSGITNFVIQGSQVAQWGHWYLTDSQLCGKHNRHEVINKFVHTSQNSQDPDLQIFCIRILGCLIRENLHYVLGEGVDYIFSCLNKENQDIRFAAAEAIERIFQPENFWLFALKLHDIEHDVAELINFLVEKTILIQQSRKFYNYEIHQKALARSTSANQQAPPGLPPIQTEILQIIENNYGTVNGTVIGHHYPPQEPPC